MNLSPIALFEKVQGRLKSRLGETAHARWLQPLQVGGLEEGELILLAPTRFMRDWIVQHYGDLIRNLVREEQPEISGIRLTIDQTRREMSSAVNAGDMTRQKEPLKDLAKDPAKEWEARNRTPASRPALSVVTYAPQNQPQSATPASAGEEGRDDLSSPLDPRFTFANFVVGKPNELAHAAARRVAESEAVTLNPLFLYGGVGLGKTHLMHAIAWHIREKTPHRRVVYMSAEKFMYQFIRALRFKDTMAFKEQFRAVDVLMIDDVQFISGKDSTQEEFFHTFNALVDQNRQIIVSADKSPHDLEGMEERLRSRLGWGLVADIHPTSYELRLGILQAKAENLAVKIPDKVLEFLAHKISANVRELEGALNRLLAHAQLVGRPINLETATELLQDLLRASERRVTIDEIQRKVAEHYKIKLSDMHSPRRARAVARPRQVAMYLAKQLTSRSLPEIGRKFGGRDHTTVIHAVRKIEELRGGDPALGEDIELLRRLLQS